MSTTTGELDTFTRNNRAQPSTTSRSHGDAGPAAYRNSSGTNSFKYARQLGQVCPPSVSLYLYRILCWSNNASAAFVLGKTKSSFPRS